MRPFTYERVADADGAIVALQRHGDGAKLLGGGTNLVDLMKLGVETPEHLVDVSGLAGAEVEDAPGGGLRIGAAVRNSDLAADRRVRERYPALAEAVLAGASGQVRNVATVAGNLLQRTRCAYFQDVTKPCNKRRPGSGCPAKVGDHRNLAVLGHSHACIATHPSDMAVALAAFDALVHLRGPDGDRQIPVRQLYRLPGEEPHIDTVLQRGDVITAVELSPAPDTERSAYRKVRDRASFSFALVSIAAAVDVRGGRLRQCRIAFGGLAHKPWRAFGAESALRDVVVTKDLLVDAARADLQEAEPLRDNAFKVPLARNLLVRTVLDLCEEAA